MSRPTGSGRGPMLPTQAPRPTKAERPSTEPLTGAATGTSGTVQSVPASVLDKIQHSRAVQAGLLAATLAGAALGLQSGGGAGASPQQQSQVARPALTNAPTAAARPAALDPCALVTAAEAAAFLEKPVTTLGAPPPSAQCDYKPQTQAVFEFPDIRFGSRPARIQINAVVLTIITGADAAVRYQAKRDTFKRDPEDREVNGLGDEAVITRDQLSVLAGNSFVNVAPDGGYDFGSGATRATYLPVQAKYDAIMTAFARTALPRITSGQPAAQSAPTAGADQAAVAPSPAGQQTPSAGPNVASGLLGALGGLALGTLAVLAYTATQARADTLGGKTEQPRVRTARHRPTKLEVIDLRIAELRKRVWDTDGLATYAFNTKPGLDQWDHPAGLPDSHDDKFEWELRELEALQDARERLVAGKPAFEMPESKAEIDARIAEIKVWDPSGQSDILQEELQSLEEHRTHVTRELPADQPTLPEDETFTPRPKGPDLPTM